MGLSLSLGLKLGLNPVSGGGIAPPYPAQSGFAWRQLMVTEVPVLVNSNPIITLVRTA